MAQQVVKTGVFQNEFLNMKKEMMRLYEKGGPVQRAVVSIARAGKISDVLKEHKMYSTMFKRWLKSAVPQRLDAPARTLPGSTPRRSNKKKKSAKKSATQPESSAV